mmetsp:Transcript_14254/g.44824  ORF Transcript_14254/g.44824 Transcript_14254/m.44824 type:complete len:246 (-) Transcript_14254:1809-2546(-)
MAFSPSSSRKAKSRGRPSSKGPSLAGVSASLSSSPAGSSSAAFSHLLKNSWNSDSSMRPSPLLSNSPNSSSLFKPLVRWCCLSTANALTCMSSSSCEASFFASPRKRLSQAEAFVSRLSKLTVWFSSFWHSSRRKDASSGSISSPLRPWILSRTATMLSFASLVNPSIVLACSSIAGDWFGACFICSSTLSTAWAVASTALAISFSRPWSSFLASASCRSRSRRRSRLFVSISFSRARPTAILSR